MITVLGAYLAGGPERMLWPSVLSAALAVSLIVAGCNVANDRHDATVDRLNNPHRPIPSERVSRNMAGYVALILLFVGLGIGWSLGGLPGAIALGAVTLGLTYTYFLKNTVLLGNGLVGFLSASAVLYGGVVAGGIVLEVIEAALLIFLFIFTREVLKSVADREGDALAGVRTIATQLGLGASMMVFGLLGIVLIICALLPWALSLANELYLFASLSFVVLPTVGIMIVLGLEANDPTVRVSLRVMKLMWFCGMVPLVLLR